MAEGNRIVLLGSCDILAIVAAQATPTFPRSLRLQDSRPLYLAALALGEISLGHLGRFTPRGDCRDCRVAGC